MSAIADRLRSRRWGRYRDPQALCHDHFRLRSTVDHVNYESLCHVVQALGGRPQTILETGVSAWGTDSTRLFDSYVRSFGGRLWSVDIEPEHVRRLVPLVGPQTTLVCDDSAAFLARWVDEHPGEQAGLVYLDSWDVDFAAPLPAAEHCVRELDAVTPALGPGTLLLIDDSPGSLEDVPDHARAEAQSLFAQFGVWPGKGMLVQQRLSERGILPIRHGYQALYRF
ncbi:MAG TPA: hypothetical protein VHX66_06880 [Solirubrobacteraceae bacterium]|nr:hypothetical protein [Solirubrobacteraceae bacterium]